MDGAGSISVTLDGTNATTVTVSSGDNDSIRNIENVIGTSGNDTITGDAENNTLIGNAGDDTISGDDGDDIIEDAF